MPAPPPENVHVHADAEALANGAADWLVRNIFTRQGTLAVCLAGGSTPRGLYQVLAKQHAGRIPWRRLHWFFGDERFVPHDHADSNYRMARETLFGTPSAAVANVHPMPTVGHHTAAEAAEAYERELKSHYRSDRLDPNRPLFAAMVLGLGEDGHTASLFPGSKALAERSRWVVAVEGMKPESRISLTYPTIESSADIVFIVSGTAKRKILARVWRGDDLPAAHLNPRGNVHWLIDRAADPRKT